MVAGFDRYFQIAPCFRDEDPRADRSPGEFYQLDMEMSFATQEDVFQAIEPVMRGVFEEFGGGRPVTPEFPRIAYRDSMLWYGSDKPDLRNPIKMQVVSEHFAGSGFKIFASLLETPGNEVRAIPAPGGGIAQVLRPDERLRPRRGPAGHGLHLLAQGRGRSAWRPLAPSPRTSAPSAPRRSGSNSDSARATPRSSSAASPPPSRPSPARRAT